MKKTKQRVSHASAAPQKQAEKQPAKEQAKSAAKPMRWLPWAGLGAALFLVFEAYGPALNGPFVLDDRSLFFDNPNAGAIPFMAWVQGVRPLLMFSYWVNYQTAGAEPFPYHATNVFLHLLGSVVTGAVALRLLDWSGVPERLRVALAVFAGGLFLLHPIQTESVAYVASRSEVLSALLYYSAFALFLYRPDDQRMTLLRALAIAVLFGAAASTKEHTLTLPAFIILTDFFWSRGGLRKNGVLYGLLAVGAIGGGLLVWQVLKAADTAGFNVQGVSPAAYFFTQCRVLWQYIRLFFLPFRQNLDPDIALSQSLFDHGAIVGLLAIAGLVAAAWIYRKRFPLAAFGILMFLLLIAPTSSIVPIRDVLAERRIYLPFLGLTLVCLEFLRRLNIAQLTTTGAVVLLICTALTYQRSRVWSSSIALWEDTVAKSPQKWRPRFQLAHAFYEEGQCPQAVQNYEQASKLGPTDVPLLVDWALALECTNRWTEAIQKLEQASTLEPTAHVFSQIGMVYAKHQKYSEALAALLKAEKADPSFEMTYVYRGNIYEVGGDRAAAAREYQRALQINSGNQPAREALGRVSR